MPTRLEDEGRSQMHFYQVVSISNFINNEVITSFHYDMFHGIAQRRSSQAPEDMFVFPDSVCLDPLEISRTGVSVPPVFRPSVHLVVDQEIAEKFRNFPNIRLVAVRFVHLVDIDYAKGDMSYFERWKDKRGRVDPDALLINEPNIPLFHKTIGTFFEVQCFRWKDVCGRFTLRERRTIRRGTPPLDEPVEIEIDGSMLDEYPVLCGADVILSEEAFRVLDSALDRDFFIVNEYVDTLEGFLMRRV